MSVQDKVSFFPNNLWDCPYFQIQSIKKNNQSQSKKLTSNPFTGRLRAQYMKQMKQMKETLKQPILSQSDSADAVSSRILAAVRIQRQWRGFMARRAMRKCKIQEIMLLGEYNTPFYTNKL